jgi:hypothetical protein
MERGTKPDAVGCKPCHWTSTLKAAIVNARRAWLRPAVPSPRAGHARAATRADRLPRRRVAWTRSVWTIAAARPSRRCAWGLEPRPRQAFGFHVREAAVDDHDRDALRPGFSQVLRHREGLASRRCCRPRVHRQHPRGPGVADILAPPICCRLQHRLAGELASLLLPRGIGVQGEDQLADLAHPLSAPALHAEDGHDARHARREQPQRIKGALADPHCASITVLATCGHSA